MASSDSSSTSDLKASVLMNLRSVTQSRKGGVPLSCLERDYKDLLGTSIPFRDLGHSSLQAFLKSIPDVISLRHKDGQLVAEGVADSSTAHIVSLVSRQKIAKTIPKPGRRNHILNKRGIPSSRYGSRSSKTSFPKSHSHKNSRHSKPSWSPSSESREIHPKPQTPPPHTSQRTHVPPRKYEMAPRFLRLQNRNPDSAAPVSTNVNSNTKPKLPRPSTPDSYQNYIDEPYVNNNFIKSPRPLQVSRPVAAKVDRTKELQSAVTSKEYIDIYAEMNNLIKQYVTTTIGQKRQNQGFISKLTLGDKKYNTYPEIASTQEAAEELAASLAVKFIKENQEHLASCPVTSVDNAEDVLKLIGRIEEIVYEKPSGMYTNGITHEYELKFNEILPENWLKILQQSTVLEVEELTNDRYRVPEGVRFIVRRVKFSSGSTTPSSVSELERPEFPYEDNVVRGIVRKDYQPNVPPLSVPFGNEWAVHIVDVSKTIAARLIDYDSLYLDMTEEMKTYYSSECLPAVEITEGLLYAACQPGSDLYLRVLAKRIKENDMVECYYVDEGYFDDIPKSDLQELSSETSIFWIPYQAIHLTLSGLEDSPYHPDDLKFLLARSLIAVVKRSTTVMEYFPNDPAINKDIYSVVLYDTEGSEDVNENDIIKEKILEAFAVKLPKPSISASGYYLTHVENNGDIYLRKLPPDSWLEEDLEKLSPSFEEACQQNVTVPHGKICVAKFEDGVWYRAILTRNSSTLKDPEKVEVFFIDYGNTCAVSTSEVCELQQFSEFLSSLGGQAIKCELFNALPSPDTEWTPAAVSKLVKLAPIDEELLIRVISEGDAENLAKVNLYKRTYQNGDSFIISINESLANQPELFQISSSLNSPYANPTLSLNFRSGIRPPVPRTASSSSFNSTSLGESNSSTSTPITSPSSGSIFKWVTTPDNIKSPDALENHNPLPLKPPEIPEVGEQFDVFVTMAANPHNFYVQPYRTVKEMTDLMTQMEQFYSSEENLIEMDVSLLKENGFYAVKHSDGCWYRAQLHSIISYDPVTVLVKYVDFGDLVTVNMFQLQNLWSKFRLLPCQGIQAALAGIQPLEKDWNSLHCVKFASMVRENKYVSIVREKRLKASKDSTVLLVKLTLIDVSDPTEDVYIHELLLKEKMARPA